MLVGCLALSGLSLLLLPRNIAYDPWSWLIFGREILHLDLNTRLAATSVKPLPMYIDTVLAVFGSSAAPILWLLIARTGALLALAVAYRLGARLAGPVAGIVAAVGLAASNEFLAYLLVQGMSEPMTAAAVLAAVDTYLAGRRRWALGCLIAAALLRPEAWPFLLGYLLWLAWPGSWLRRAIAVVVGIAIPFSWFVIDWFGARQLLRSAHAATQESQGGPLLSRQPGIATIRETWHLLSAPVEILFVVGFVAALVAWRRDGRPNLSVWLGVAALGWLAVDAVLAQGRFATGAARYLLPGEALACVVVGILVADVVRVVRRWTPRPGASLAAVVAVWLVLAAWLVPRALETGRQLHRNVALGKLAVRFADGLPHAVALAGGRDAVMACGPVTTRSFQVPFVAWTLRLPVGDIGYIAPSTGTVFQQNLEPKVPIAERTTYHYVGSAGPTAERWTVLSTCSPG